MVLSCSFSKAVWHLIAEWTGIELLDIQPNQFGDARGRLRRASGPPAILFVCVVLVSLFFIFKKSLPNLYLRLFCPTQMNWQTNCLFNLKK